MDNKSGSFLLCALLATLVCALVGGVAFVAVGKGNGTNSNPDNRIGEEEIAHASKNLFHLFRDAQYDFIHRHGGTMAKSVTELGDGFSIGSYGSLIHEEIWLARLDRPESDIPPAAQQSKAERAILSRPYRYAVLPVQNCNGPELDARTSCILAVPVDPDAEPTLVLFAGPVRSDPRDFYRSYPIRRVADASARKAFRDTALNGTPFDKAFLDRHLPEWNVSEPTDSEPPASAPDSSTFN